MSSMKCYSVERDRENRITLYTEEVGFHGFCVRIRFLPLLAVVLVAVLGIGGWRYYNEAMAESEKQPVILAEFDMEETAGDVKEKTPWDEQGFVFAESSHRELDEAEVLALADYEDPRFQRLLRMAINEIYARHGQVFLSGEINDRHYGSFTWYRETEKHDVAWTEFNKIEEENLNLLIQTEKKYGYR